MSTAYKLSASDKVEEAVEFVFEGLKNNCIIWTVGDPQPLALSSFAWGSFALNTPMQIWNEEPPAAAEAHSRFTIEEDGRIAPNVAHHRKLALRCARDVFSLRKSTPGVYTC